MTAPKPQPSKLPSGLQRNLQRVRIRTKIVVPMVLLAVGPTLAIGAFMIWRARESLQESVVRRVAFDTASKARAVEEFLAGVESNVRFLSQAKAVRALASTNAVPGDPRLAGLREAAERDFVVFQRGHPYCQAQCLGALGQQLIRLDARGETLQLIPAPQLENQSDRSYVRAASALTAGQVYVSPMHVDVVHGMLGAVLRFVTPVPDDAGGTRGLLVVGVCAEHILSQIGPLPAGMEASLVGNDGVYLGYVGESLEKQTLYRLEKRRPLAADYTTEQAAALLNNQSDRPAVKTAQALIFSAPVALKGDHSAEAWKLLISYPRAPIEAPIHHLTWVLAIVTAVVAAAAGLLGILITHYLARPVASLRRATCEIAAGDLTKRVEITTGDEIEALAADFNTMTERLSEAQARLEQWNVQLEREVTQQTEQVRRLQAGFARADKLASIGQITAGVMHEIGNPLAAIKTKIQVAEEAGELDPNFRFLSDEILVEVDRLTTFLRSFSRLARLRDFPTQTRVSLSEVVESVVTLLAADLRRRHVALRREFDRAVPNIRGDAEQLRHLLMNLVLNAADASTAGGEVVVQLRSSAVKSGDGALRTEVQLQVIDDGTGVDPAILDKIWNPFFTTKSEGTGLGLAISRQIVQEHGGTISLRSEQRKGTEVTVTFPAWPSDVPEADIPRGRNKLHSGGELILVQ